ncbi:MAG: CoA-binding protein [Candidatus Pacearchaeota archaeon]|nr:CoA-binding protein [Candidatus Pacearchaeota archaeon]
MKEIGSFVNPKNIALIGASELEGKVGNVLMKKLLKFKGEIIPISIKHEKILGIKAYPSVLDYKEKIDLAIIAIPSENVKQVLEECGKKKIKNVIIISAGFSEIGNNKLEEEIIEISKKYKINLLGPNCFGVANPYLNLDTTFSNLSAKKGSTAFISQSGALWSYVADISHSKNLGFSAYISLGNMADLEFSDFIEYFNKDKRTKKIILYIEKLKQGKRFIEVCKKSRKKIIVIKAGKTKKGKEATISHTGSLATDFEIYKGAFKQAGVELVESFPEAFNIPKQKIKPKGKKITIVTNAGGAGALLTDYLVEMKYDVQPPIDLIGTALAEDYKKTFNKLKKEDSDSIVVILTPQAMSQPEETAKEIVKLSKFKSVIAVFLGAKSITKAKKILSMEKIKCYTSLP